MVTCRALFKQSGVVGRQAAEPDVSGVYQDECAVGLCARLVHFGDLAVLRQVDRADCNVSMVDPGANARRVAKTLPIPVNVADKLLRDRSLAYFANCSKR